MEILQSCIRPSIWTEPIDTKISSLQTYGSPSLPFFIYVVTWMIYYWYSWTEAYQSIKVIMKCYNQNLWFPEHSSEAHMYWKSRDIMMPTLSLLVAPEDVVMTTSGATSDDKVGIMTTLGLKRISPSKGGLVIYVNFLPLSGSVGRFYKIPSLFWAMVPDVLI